MLSFAIPIVPAGGLALVVAGVAVALVAFLRPERRRIAAVLGVVLGAAGAGLCAMQHPGASGDDVRHGERVRLLPVRGVTAATDRGAAVPLGRPAEGEDAGDVPEEFAWRVIAAHPAARLANCHGWVFADGRYWVPSEWVDRILADNGYRRTAAPIAGDLIVYRDATGRPFHSGIVKAVGNDRFVLVESKWGLLHVFWHTPENQAFGGRFEYWHSDREGHVLEFQGDPDGASFGGGSAANAD